LEPGYKLGTSTSMSFAYSWLTPWAEAPYLEINIYPGSKEVIKTNGEVTYHPDYKTMMNFETGYSGISTRKAIIEERNVFCGFCLTLNGVTFDRCHLLIIQLKFIWNKLHR
jgi:hypothetical protein